MSNRPREVEKWSASIQVNMSQALKKLIEIKAIETSSSQSEICRGWILLGIEKELAQDS